MLYLRDSSDRDEVHIVLHKLTIANPKTHIVWQWWHPFRLFLKQVEQGAKQVVQKAEHAVESAAHAAKKVEKSVENEVQQVGHKVSQAAHKIEHEVGTAVRTAKREVHDVAARVDHEAQSVGHAVEQKVQSGISYMHKQAINAYQAYQSSRLAIEHSAGVVENTLRPVEQEVGKIEQGMEKNAGKVIQAGSEIAAGVIQATMTIQKSFIEHPKQFIVGALSSMGENMSLGMCQAPSPDNATVAYEAGRVVGDMGGTLAGVIPITAGGGAVASGYTVAVAGSGTLVAIPAVVGLASAGMGAIAFGSAVEVKSANGLVNHKQGSNSDIL